ncbi:MAG TPA: hypothetical protein VND99_01425 [Candidatus Acidoferrales bacterium]|nr:hypothetical protein [Candidatus Acidoferrales bacterium]
MNTDTQKQDNQASSSETDKQNQTAVPYIPPPPPENSSQKKYRSPLVNGMLVALVILLAGFMMYHYVGHQLTQLAGVSDVKTISPTPSTVPSVSSVISPSISPAISPSPKVSASPSQ